MYVVSATQVAPSAELQKYSIFSENLPSAPSGCRASPNSEITNTALGACEDMAQKEKVGYFQ